MATSLKTSLLQEMHKKVDGIQSIWTICSFLTSDLAKKGLGGEILIFFSSVFQFIQVTSCFWKKTPIGLDFFV